MLLGSLWAREETGEVVSNESENAKGTVDTDVADVGSMTLSSSSDSSVLVLIVVVFRGTYGISGYGSKHHRFCSLC